MGRKQPKKPRPLEMRGGYTTTKKADLSKLKFSTRPAGGVKRPPDSKKK